MSFTGPLFIVGMPRSGTKLLRGLLNQHPLISIPNIETHFLPYWEKHWSEYGDLSDRNDFSCFYSQVIHLPYFIYMREISEIIQEDNWYQSCDDFSISGIFEALIRYDAHVPVGSKKIWGDKTPSYITQVPLIKSIFPEARFIHIIRDVRDYSLSMNTAWGKNMVRATDRWVDGINIFRQNIEDYGEKIMELRYEDLLDNPAKDLHRICAFLGLKFDNRMLELGTPCENLGATQKKKEIVKNNKQKFLTEMTSKQRKSIECIAKPLLKEYGYQVNYTGISKRINKSQMLIYKIMDAINLFRYEAKKRGIVGGIKFQWSLYRTARD